MSSPWTRPRDRVIAGLIVLVVVGAGVLLWAGSDIRATDASTSGAASKPLQVPASPPRTLTEAWRAPSPDTAEPIAGGGVTVVTGNGGTVTGHDARTGQQRWHYRRDLRLCTLGQAFSGVLAVYRNDNEPAACSEITRLDRDTGRRLAQRNADTELGTRLLTDGSHVVSTGRRLINVWGEDLIRAMEYGQLPAPVEPNRQHRPGCAPTSETGSSSTSASPTTVAPRCTAPLGRQPREGCRFSSVAVAAGKIAVVERCPWDPAEWLTVIGTTHNEDGESKSDEPKVLLSAELPGVGARVVALARSAQPRVAVALGHTKQLLVYGSRGKLQKQYTLDLPSEDLLGELPGHSVVTTRGLSSVFWYTGSVTMALDDQTLRPRWTLPDTLGPAVRWAGEALVPIADGLAVIDENTGKPKRTIAVDRDGYSGPVRLGYVGPVLLEQRGPTLVALR